MTREVQVEVIAVEAVGVGAENRCERPAGPPVNRAKKRTLGNVAIPTREHGYLTSIRQPERRNVKGIG